MLKRTKRLEKKTAKINAENRQLEEDIKYLEGLEAKSQNKK